MGCTLPSVKPKEEILEEKRYQEEKARLERESRELKEKYQGLMANLGVCFSLGLDGHCSGASTDTGMRLRKFEVNIKECGGERGYRIYYKNFQVYSGFISEKAENRGGFVGPNAVVCGKAFLHPGTMILDWSVLKGEVDFKMGSILMGEALIDGKGKISKGSLISDQVKIRGALDIAEKHLFLGLHGKYSDLSKANRRVLYGEGKASNLSQVDKKRRILSKTIQKIGNKKELLRLAASYPEGLFRYLHLEGKELSQKVSWLVQGSQNIDALNKWGDTALHEAARNFEIGKFKALLSRGADPRLQNSFGRNAVHELLLGLPKNLSEKNIIQVGEILRAVLLRKKEVLNARDEFNRTPLMYSAMNSYPRLSKRLLINGADPFLKDVNSMNALNYAKATGNVKMIKFFENWLNGEETLFYY